MTKDRVCATGEGLPNPNLDFEPVDIHGIPEQVDREWQQRISVQMSIAIATTGKSKPELIEMAQQDGGATIMSLIEMMDDFQERCEGMATIAGAASARAVIAAAEAVGLKIPD